MRTEVRSRQRIGLFLRGGDYAYQTEITLGAHEECERHGLDLYCFAGGVIDDGQDPRNAIYRLARRSRLNAAIVAPGTMGADEHSPGLRELRHQIPELPTVSLGTTLPNAGSLRIDNAGGVRSLTRHLIESHGRRRIAFLGGIGDESNQRLQGYRQALREADLELREERMLAGDFTTPSGRAAVDRLFSRTGLGCDAIVAANDWMALGALEALQERGLRVPEDVSVVGFDDIEDSRFYSPPLTTVRQQPRRLGARAVSKLLDALEGRVDLSPELVATTLMLRQSCGCFGDSSDADAAPASAGEPLHIALGKHRRRWLRAIWAASPPSDQLVNETFAERLADALLDDLQSGEKRHFTRAVEGVVSETAHLGNVTAWHRTLSHLRSVVTPFLTASTRVLLLADTLFERAHLMVAGLAERSQARRRMGTEALLRNSKRWGPRFEPPSTSAPFRPVLQSIFRR